jgi:protein SCO1/2
MNGLRRRKSESKLVAVSTSVALACLLTACSNSPKHYSLQGRVLGKSALTQQLTVKHSDIPGFMTAMTMTYPIKDSQGFQQVQPGDLITADVVVGGNNGYWLEHLAIKDKAGRGTVSSLPPHELLPGEPVPDIALTNQDGQALHLADFRGKALLVTFVYTRCPFATFCPLTSSKFAAIQKELAKTPGDYEKTHLITISLDPKYDTPPVMRKYGLAYLSDDPKGFGHWEFVSTSPDDLRKLATAFGLEYFEQDNLISHSMKTVLLATDGTVSHSWSDNQWTNSDVVAALRQQAGIRR